MRVWSHADCTFPLPERHRYPLPKYPLLRDAAVARGHVAELPEPIDADALWRVHEPAFLERMRFGALDRRESRVLGLPWSEALVDRALRGTQGTLEAARDALDGRRVGMVLGGGTHHAGYASARGYCLFNDVAVVCTELRRERRARRVLVVDCDVHQGDGTAELLGGDRDPEAYTVSLQCARNYPFTRIPSDLDVELPQGTGDDAYLEALDDALDTALGAFGAPDLVVYLAGADPWEGDGLGRLAMTKPGLRARDVMVLDRALDAGAAVAVTLAGGYPPDVQDGVEINLQTLDEVAERVR
jgi:acetoin utilization deacetylase AcuC-like enzyme